MQRGEPHHDLSWIKHKISSGPDSYYLTKSARDGVLALGLDVSDVCECVEGLTPACFHKTMESDRMPGLWQDVYRTTYQGVEIYLKLQIAPAGQAVVISFKQR